MDDLQALLAPLYAAVSEEAEAKMAAFLDELFKETGE